ncbi:hypothetical protein PBCV1_a560R [Paramecium bursaria Chlorella virus 1]|uniref:Uncharacterized protein n=1 Tax=Paramecium bursaria Chlorella virus 1 TaxID=10506 RepID=O41042_PBCV1|nr:hypothetical protein PBCV1_a560R [Paramecium bursaria Chlorella virus 1]AAC97000.1 hypothetical protein [Paramecium bursaria Chlorella virus 1]
MLPVKKTDAFIFSCSICFIKSTYFEDALFCALSSFFFTLSTTIAASFGALSFTTLLSFLIVSTAVFVRVFIFASVEVFVFCISLRSFFSFGSSSGMSRISFMSF